MKTYGLISAANAASNVTSTPVTLGDLKDYSIHVKFSSATLGGTLKLELSNDGSDWVEIDDSSQTVTAGESHTWNVTAANYLQVRVQWTASAGTGTITATAIIKENVIKGA